MNVWSFSGFNREASMWMQRLGVEGMQGKS